MPFALVHSCCRSVVHFLAHKTTLLTLTLRHNNTIKNNMNSNSTKGRKWKPKDVHITIFTDPTKVVQPCKKPASSAHRLPNVDHAQHKKIKHDDAAPTSNTSLQFSIPLKPASLPGLIMVNKLSTVIQQTSWHKFLTLTFAISSVNALNYRYYTNASFVTKSIMEPTTRNQRQLVELC
jgi:hypothetical protein